MTSELQAAEDRRHRQGAVSAKRHAEQAYHEAYDAMTSCGYRTDTTRVDEDTPEQEELHRLAGEAVDACLKAHDATHAYLAALDRYKPQP